MAIIFRKCIYLYELVNQLCISDLTGYDDGTTSATYGYDDLFRKISESVNYGPFTKTNAYGYLKNGLKETFTGPDNITYGYLYDDNNQLAGVQIPNSGFITIGEYNWNRPANMTLPGGSTKQFTYDPLMRIKQITTKDSGQNVLLNYQYNYDKMDNIVSKSTGHGSYAYGYDDWQLPTLAELQSLYVHDKKYKGYETDCGQRVKIVPDIELSCGWVWTSETSAIQAYIFNFNRGYHYADRMVHNRAYRALPVRNLK